MRNQSLHKKIILAATIIIAATSALAVEDVSDDARVHEKFLAAYSGVCDQPFDSSELADSKPFIYQLFFRRSYQSSTQPDFEYSLYEYPCYAGAYNFSSVYFSVNDYDEVQQVFFSFPDYDVTYKDEDETIIDQIALNGFTAWESLTNPTFDQKSMTLISNSKWRGLGDASSSGSWQFKQGRWVLKSFDIDPTYDGKFSRIRIFGEGAPDN